MTSNLPWYILLFPLGSAAAIMWFTRRARTLSSFISVAAVLASFVCSCLLFGDPNPSAVTLTWIDFPGVFTVPLGLTLDGLSRTMLLVVTGVGSLIHI
jgi:NADH-quinone oxidoreductase subunit L